MELILLNIYTNLLTKTILSLFIILVELSRKDKDRQRQREIEIEREIALLELNIYVCSFKIVLALLLFRLESH